MTFGVLRTGVGLGAVLVAASWAGGAPAQQSSGFSLTGGGPQIAALPQGAPPPRLVFTLSSALNADDNRNLSRTDPRPGTVLDTTLGLTFNARTRQQSLLIAATGVLEMGHRGASGGNDGLRQPSLRIAYSRDTGNARLAFSSRYSRSNVDLFDPLTLPDGSLSTSDLTARTGTVDNSATRLTLETGLHDPVGFILSGSATARSYSDTSSPSVYDRRSRSARLTTRLTLSPLTRIDLNLGYRRETNSDSAETRRRQREVSVEMQHALSPILILDAQLGYGRNRTDQTISGLPFVQRSNGGFGKIGLMRQMPNGTASITLAADRDSLGTRNSLRFARALTLPRGATLSIDAGLSKRGAGTTQIVGALSYRETRPNATISATLDRSVALDSLDNDVAYTRLALSYSHKITELSAFGLSIDLRRAASGGLGSVNSTDRSTLRATYSHDLTPDWSLQAGYQYRRLDDEATGKAASNSVFVTLGRSFVLQR